MDGCSLFLAPEFVLKAVQRDWKHNAKSDYIEVWNVPCLSTKGLLHGAEFRPSRRLVEAFGLENNYQLNAGRKNIYINENRWEGLTSYTAQRNPTTCSYRWQNIGIILIFSFFRQAK